MRNPLELPDELQALADMISTERRRLEQEMHTPGCTRQGDSTACCIAAKGGSNPKTINALEKLSDTYTRLGKELRQWTEHSRTTLDRMTPARKASVMIAFVQELPLSARRDIYQVLARLEADRPDGLGLELHDRFGAAPARVEAADV